MSRDCVRAWHSSQPAPSLHAPAMGSAARDLGSAKYNAIKAFLEGEALLDAGDHEKGIRYMRRAVSMEPELELEPDDWPAWAQALRHHLVNAPPPPPADADCILQPGTCGLDREQAAFLARTFCTQHYVIVDHAIDATLCQAAFREIQAADIQGILEPATIHSAETQGNVLAPDRRSDRIAWLDLAGDATLPSSNVDGGSHSCSRRRWSSVALAVQQVDSLVRRLKDELPDELSGVLSRLQPMVSAYPMGARFERHCDNHCESSTQPRRGQTGPAPHRAGIHEVLARAAQYQGRANKAMAASPSSADAPPTASARDAGSEPAAAAAAAAARGACANRRRLSVLLYCTPDWNPSDGGALRLFKSRAAFAERPTQAEDHADEQAHPPCNDALVDVVPVQGRMILFASDQRVPHEVLPVTNETKVRYAIALWYADAPADDVVRAAD